MASLYNKVWPTWLKQDLVAKCLQTKGVSDAKVRHPLSGIFTRKMQAFQVTSTNGRFYQEVLTKLARKIDTRTVVLIMLLQTLHRDQVLPDIEKTLVLLPTTLLTYSKLNRVFKILEAI